MAKLEFSRGIFFLVTLVLIVMGCGNAAKIWRYASHNVRFVRVQAHRSEIQHIVLVVLENTSYDDTIRQPFFSQLIRNGALLENYLALAHPSQPNYVAMVSGQLPELTNENLSLDREHLGDLIERAGKTWKSYAEGYPGNCFLGAARGAYARKHVPFLSFSNVQSNPVRCARVVKGSEFLVDFANHALPDFSFYTPDLNHDGHDTSIQDADDWLGQFFEAVMTSPDQVASTLFIVTFDEGAIRANADNRVATVLYGAGVRVGSRSSMNYNHYSLLRTIEEILQLPSLGLNDQGADPFDGIWLE